jgi:hypothetical protein
MIIAGIDLPTRSLTALDFRSGSSVNLKIFASAPEAPFSKNSLSLI